MAANEYPMYLPVRIIISFEPLPTTYSTVSETWRDGRVLVRHGPSVRPSVHACMHSFVRRKKESNLSFTIHTTHKDDNDKYQVTGKGTNEFGNFTFFLGSNLYSTSPSS
jgi:hypothetical protein